MSTDYFSESRKFSFRGAHTVREFREHHSIDMLKPDSQVYAALLYKMFAMNGFEVEPKRDRASYSNSAFMKKGRDRTVSIDKVSVDAIYRDGKKFGDDTRLLLSVEGSFTSHLIEKSVAAFHKDVELLGDEVYTILVKKFLPSTSNSEE